MFDGNISGEYVELVSSYMVSWGNVFFIYVIFNMSMNNKMF